MISGLLAAAVWLAHLARERAAALADARAQLRREFGATRGAEIGLRELNTELEARVDRRTAELRDAVTELEAFSYSVSHDLRSPLGAVLNFASILEEDFGSALDVKGREYLKRISSCAQSALDLMDALMLYSQVGREELHPRSVDVGALVAGVVAEQRIGRFAAAQVEVEPLPPAQADPELLRLVVAHLISNALKASEGQEQPEIRIGASQQDGEAVYFVRDNGVGFDPRFGHKLFTVFERLHSKDEFCGSGVGLATAARIVRRHGGRIWGEGQPGQGATFSFTLRPAEAKADAAAR